MFDVNKVPEKVRKYLKPVDSCYMSIIAIGKDSHVIVHDMPEFDDIILEDWSPFYWDMPKPKDKPEGEHEMTLKDVMWVVFTQAPRSGIWEMSAQDIANLAYYYKVRESHIMLGYLFEALYSKAVDGDRIVIRFSQIERIEKYLIEDATSWLDDQDHLDDPYYLRDKKE